MAITIEELLHSRIAGKIEYPVRAAERVNAATCEDEAGIPERLVQDREVAARHGDTVAEVLRWSCAELDLTAWLQGQEAGSGQDTRFLEGVEYLLNPVEWHRQQGVYAVADEPLKLGADRSGWTGFEADRTDMSLSGGLRKGDIRLTSSFAGSRLPVC